MPRPRPPEFPRRVFELPNQRDDNGDLVTRCPARPRTSALRSHVCDGGWTKHVVPTISSSAVVSDRGSHQDVVIGERATIGPGIKVISDERPESLKL